MIDEEDLEIISGVRDPLEKASRMGYVVNKDLIKQLLENDIDILLDRMGAVRIFLLPEEAASYNLRKVFEAKIIELYNDNIYDLMVLSHIYRDKSQKLSRLHSSFVRQRTNVPLYMKRIIRGIGLNSCTSIKQIENFKLSEEDEEIRRKFPY